MTCIFGGGRSGLGNYALRKSITNRLQRLEMPWPSVLVIVAEVVLDKESDDLIRCGMCVHRLPSIDIFLAYLTFSPLWFTNGLYSIDTRSRR